MLGELTGEEIDGLLRSEAVGRIGCYGFGRSYVVPVTYAYDGIAVYCHSREGLKLRMIRATPPCASRSTAWTAYPTGDL